MIGVFLLVGLLVLVRGSITVEPEFSMALVHRFFPGHFFDRDDFVNDDDHYGLVMIALRNVLQIKDLGTRQYSLCCLGYILKFRPGFIFHEFESDAGQLRSDFTKKYLWFVQRGLSQHHRQCIPEKVNPLCVCFNSVFSTAEPGRPNYAPNAIVKVEKPQCLLAISAEHDDFINGVKEALKKDGTSSIKYTYEYFKQQLLQAECMMRKRYCQVGHAIRDYDVMLYNSNELAVQNFVDYLDSGSDRLDRAYIPLLSVEWKEGGDAADWCPPGGKLPAAAKVILGCESCFRCGMAPDPCNR